MIKEIEELQDQLREAAAHQCLTRHQTLLAHLATIGLLHQLAVKVERLEKRGKPRLMMERNRIRQVPEDEEGGP